MTMITTVSTSQTELLQSIQTLHNGGRPFHADLTYSTGAFWRELAAPGIRADIAEAPPHNKARQNLQADLRHLPFRAESLESVICDPPFIHAPGKNSIMGQRFSGYPSQRALMAMYQDAAEEIHDALMPGGLLVWKAQDIVESGKQVWNHMLLWAYCTLNVPEPLYTLEDFFILVAKNRIQGHNHGRQVHARKLHSYFLVFRKGGKRGQSRA